MSVPNVGHLDPQRGGCCTVMPYLLGDVLELPLTTTQDYSLFHIMRDYSTKHWQRQMNLIMGRHGLISFNIHPDYVIAPRERRSLPCPFATPFKSERERKICFSSQKCRQSMVAAKERDGC